MKLKPNTVFLAMDYHGGPLLCYVNEIKNNVAYCEVINGAWEIGFNIETLEMCYEGTHRYVRDRLGSRGYGAKVVLTDLPKGQRTDYDERIAAALKILKDQNDPTSH
jgi:hypothetical protein